MPAEETRGMKHRPTGTFVQDTPKQLRPTNTRGVIVSRRCCLSSPGQERSAHTLYPCFCPTSQCGRGHRNQTRSIEFVPQVPHLLGGSQVTLGVLPGGKTSVYKENSMRRGCTPRDVSKHPSWALSLEHPDSRAGP